MKEEKTEKEQAYAQNTFDNVAQRYDEIEFFKISARHVAELIKGRKSDDDLNILDVACGTGNVVLECASSLSNAAFEAMDISDGMLSVAKKNAEQLNIENIEFKLQDITKLNEGQKYNVITCSYALFFLPDSVNVLKTLVSHLNKGGILIFTSFLAKAFQPTVNILLPLLKEYGSPSAQEYEVDRWENLKHESDIRRLCLEASVSKFEILEKEIRYELTMDEWWELLNNTGFKGMLMELSSENYERTKRELFQALSMYQDEEGRVEMVADSYFTLVECEHGQSDRT
jgi:ubiquinone/menaquinone biosynthesis C-methylase UbiE